MADVVIDGQPVPLPRVTWAVASVVGPDVLDKCLVRPGTGGVDQITGALTDILAFLSPEERAEVAVRQERMARAAAERRLWTTQNESMAMAMATGVVDSVILAAGEQADWVEGTLHGVLESSDVSLLSSEWIVNHATHHVMEIFAPNLFDQFASNIDGVIAPAVDALASASADGVAHALGAVADAHVPVMTIVMAFSRASKAAKAGASADRVAEGLGLDVVVGGGGIAAGAAIGTAVFPGVGTVIGGIVGGFIGKGTASHIKERHLREAQARAAKAIEKVGRAVSASRWMQVAATMAEEAKALSATQVHLAGTALRRRRGLVPPLEHYVLDAAATAGQQDVELLGAELATWQEELAATSGDDTADVRGALLLTRPDLCARMDVPDMLRQRAAAACESVAEERRQLALG